MIYNEYDVVVVPFPFTDKSASKRRPALVLSSKKFHGKELHYVLAMITSTENEGWFLDTEITKLDDAGLPSPSKVRMKIFTLDGELILKKIGSLAPVDRKNVKSSLKSLLGI